MVPTKRSAIALPWRPHGRPADIDGGEHRVERGGELGVAVPDHEPDATGALVEVQFEVSRLLVAHSWL
jgi:hypothetical protein